MRVTPRAVSIVVVNDDDENDDGGKGIWMEEIARLNTKIEIQFQSPTLPTSAVAYVNS